MEKIKLLCKKNIYSLKENNYYNSSIKNEFEIFKYVLINNYELYTFITTTKDNFSNPEDYDLPYLYDYFYTPREVRLLKIKKVM